MDINCACYRKVAKFLLLTFLLILPPNVFAAKRTINLVVGYKTVYYANKAVKAIAVNNQIPAPTLHFKEGDDVIINVYNCLNQETAIHWHGVLVPWQMDGVVGVAQRGIKPGHVFTYHFKLMQAGTYWYHAHAELQEQQGLYGAFLIDPTNKPRYKYTKDYVVVLSDWSNTYPDQIMANLKKSGDYYAPRFPLQPSLAKFINDYQKANCNERENLLNDYRMMQQMRMSIYDLSDVAYDAFLLNGQSCRNPWTAPVQVGDIVRLRFIGAAGDTIYHVKISHASMVLVHVQGNDVVPYSIRNFTISPGETYDVLVSINKDEPYIIYAEARDKVGAAYGALITNPTQYINYAQVIPFPEPLPITREMIDNMMMKMNHESIHMSKPSHLMKNEKSKSIHYMNSMFHDSMNSMQSHHHSTMTPNMNVHGNMKAAHMHNMEMPTEPSIIGDRIATQSQSDLLNQTMGTKYQNLKAATKTNDLDKPIKGVIQMELFGYMGRFIWFINGLPEYKAEPICLEPGKRYRIIFTNNSMMHHPMHIHGHWFILRNGHGAYDPLLHTIDVPPGATVTTDIDADASGQWFFHCHLLYHMVAGMSRVFQYSTLIELINGEVSPQNIVKQTHYVNRPIVRVDEARSIDVALVEHPVGHHAEFWLATLLDIGEDPFHNVQRITYKGLYGYDYDKLELFTNDAEIKKGTVENADIDIFYWHLLSQFWSVKGGLNYFYRPASHPYWQPGIGIEGIMPYFIDTDVRAYLRCGSVKLDIELSRDTQFTNNFFIRLGIRSILASKTVSLSAIGSGLNQMRYMVRPYYRLMPGLNFFVEYEHEQAYGVYRNIQRNAGESTSENTLIFGISILF